MVKNSYNIKEIRQLHKLTQEEMARQLGISRELVNKMESGKCGVSKATAALLRQFLAEKKSESFSHDVDIMGGAHPAPQPQNLPYFEQRREQKIEKAPLQVPLVGIKAQAGYLKGFEQTDYIDTLDKYSLPPGVNPAGAVWSYFEVDGDSMEPTLYAGDVVLTSMLPHEDWNDIKNFYVYVILTTEQLLIKRVYKKNDEAWVLLSDNEEAYPQITLKVEDVKQVWVFRRHIRSKVSPPKEFKITA